VKKYFSTNSGLVNASKKGMNERYFPERYFHVTSGVIKGKIATKKASNKNVQVSSRTAIGQ